MLSFRLWYHHQPYLHVIRVERGEWTTDTQVNFVCYCHLSPRGYIIGWNNNGIRVIFLCSERVGLPYCHSDWYESTGIWAVLSEESPLLSCSRSNTDLLYSCGRGKLLSSSVPRDRHQCSFEVASLEEYTVRHPPEHTEKSNARELFQRDAHIIWGSEHGSRSWPFRNLAWSNRDD